MTFNADVDQDRTDRLIVFLYQQLSHFFSNYL